MQETNRPATGLERAGIAGTQAQRYSVAGQRVDLDLFVIETTRRRTIEERVFYAVRATDHQDAFLRFEEYEGQPVQIETVADGISTERIQAVRHALEHLPRED